MKTKKTAFKIRIIITSLFLFLSLKINAQILSPAVITTGGDFLFNGTTLVTFTIGEPLTETFSDSNNYLTQGFNQPELNITLIEEKENNHNIKAFPNPAQNSVLIQVNSIIDQKMDVELTNIENKVLIKKKINVGETKIAMDISPFSKGFYFIRIIQDNEAIKIFKIEKIH